MTKHVIVIGAGISGLACSIQMAKRGFSVTLFEKNATPGGKVGEIRFNGFRWDTGPSLLTLPDLLNELSSQSTKAPKLIKLKNVCRYFFSDGTVVNASSNPETFAKEAESKLGVPAGKVRSFLARNKKIYKLTSGLFLFSPFHKLRSFIRSDIHLIGLYLPRLGMHKIMHSVNEKYFREKRITQLFDRYATYNGSNPYKAPATLNMIAHLEHNDGAFLPREGMYGVIQYLTSLARESGVNLITGSPVDQILLDNKKAIGVVSDSRKHTADYVINATDVDYAYTSLLSSFVKKPALKKKEYSTSAYIFYWGVNKIYPGLDVHNILFSEDYKSEFDALYQEKKLYADPTVYIYISSKVIPEDAPEGFENWFVMINAPVIHERYSNEDLQRARTIILQKLRKSLGKDIESQIVSETVKTPADIQSSTNSWLGSIYGASSNSVFSAFLRHPNFSRKIKNLFFAGGSVHPGGGIPLCLASAKIVSSLIPDKK